MSAILISPLEQQETIQISHSQQEALGKRGRAELFFDINHHQRTSLARQYIEYPFHITRSHYLDASWPDFPTLCLQSVSGGLLQGDRVSLSIDMAADTTAQVTTQASTKVHSMQCDYALQTAEITLGPSSYLEYLSDSMILFPRSCLHTILKIRMENRSKGLFRESFFYHDPAGVTEPLFDRYLSEVIISNSEGKLLALDRQSINLLGGQQELRDVLIEYPYQSGVYILGGEISDDVQQGLYSIIDNFEDTYAGISALPNSCGYYLRLLTKDAFTLRQLHDALTEKARWLLMNKNMTLSWKK